MPEPSVFELMIGVSIGMGTGHAIVIGHLSLAIGWIVFGYLVLELTAARISVEEPCSYKKRRSLRTTTKTKLTKRKQLRRLVPLLLRTLVLRFSPRLPRQMCYRRPSLKTASFLGPLCAVDVDGTPIVE